MQGEAGQCSEYIAEMTSDVDSEWLEETTNLPLLRKSDWSSSEKWENLRLTGNFVSVKKAELLSEKYFIFSFTTLPLSINSLGFAH